LEPYEFIQGIANVFATADTSVIRAKYA